MIEGAFNNISAAFEVLLEEIEDEIEYINQSGAKAFAAGHYERVDEARGHAERLTGYRGKLVALRKEWQSLSTSFVVETEEDEEDQFSRRDLDRLKRGVRTPEDAFRQPILQVLVEKGGSGKVRDVLTRVEELMRDQLNEADYQPLPSTPNSTRWYNTAQWARNTMVNEGLLRDDSPRGTWEISEAGRRLLESRKK